MHYVGMLAFILPVPVLYDWPTTVLSRLAGVFSSAVAFFVVSAPQGCNTSPTSATGHVRSHVFAGAPRSRTSVRNVGGGSGLARRWLRPESKVVSAHWLLVNIEAQMPLAGIRLHGADGPRP